MKERIIKLSIVFLLLSIIVISVGCFRKPTPLGKDYDIRVLADSTIWSESESILRDVFEQIDYTPQPEKMFTIIKADQRNYKRFKNLIFLSTLDAQDEISKAINSSLSEQAKSKIEKGNIIFVKKQQWADSQIIMFLIGKNIASLVDKINEQRAEISFQFNEHWTQLHKKILYNLGEQFDEEAHLLTSYAWTIRMPLDYKMEIQSARDKFVMLHRKVPLRWVSIFWEDATDPDIVTKEYCIAKRNEIGKLYYENEEVEEKFEPVIAKEIVFQNRRALKLKGLWKNDEKVAGGPFRMYCFYDERTERVYFVDMHMFAPDLKKSKMHYLRQMDIIAQTFKTNMEITVDQIHKKEL